MGNKHTYNDTHNDVFTGAFKNKSAAKNIIFY